MLEEPAGLLGIEIVILKPPSKASSRILAKFGKEVAPAANKFFRWLKLKLSNGVPIRSPFIFRSTPCPFVHAAPGCAAASAGGGQAGRMRVKVEPWPNRLSARRRPW